MSRPIRRVLFRAPVTGGEATAIHLGRPLLAGSSVLPAHSTGPVSPMPEGIERALSGLAPGGVYRAAPVTWSAGGLLHHRFTLTGAASVDATPAVCSLWHCPAGHPGWLLATTQPCGARTFLGRAEALTRPSGRLIRAPA